MNELVKIINNRDVVTDSLTVAKYFNKVHAKVVRSIEQLLDNEEVKQGAIFGKLIIEVEVGKGAFKKVEAYQMNRDGFSLLAMGFTGKEALTWKIKYIKAFNEMEAKLIEQHKQLDKEKELKLLMAESEKIESDKKLNMFKINKIMEDFGKPSEINGLPRTKPVAYLRGDEKQQVAPFCDLLGLYGEPMIIYIPKQTRI